MEQSYLISYTVDGQVVLALCSLPQVLTKLRMAEFLYARKFRVFDVSDGIPHQLHIKFNPTRGTYTLYDEYGETIAMNNFVMG